MRYLLALMFSACALTTPAPPPNPYVAAIDVSCFLYAAERSEGPEQLASKHKLCATMLFDIYTKRETPAKAATGTP